MHCLTRDCGIAVPATPSCGDSGNHKTFVNNVVTRTWAFDTHRFYRFATVVSDRTQSYTELLTSPGSRRSQLGKSLAQKAQASVSARGTQLDKKVHSSRRSSLSKHTMPKPMLYMLMLA